MSLFARALSGAAQGVAQVTNKWIDEDIAQQRAQFIAELQRTTATNIRNDDAAFRDKRAPIERDNMRQDVLAKGDAARQAELAGLQDAPLQEARRANADAEADAEIQRKLRAGEKLLPFEQKRATVLAEADAGTRAKYREKAPDMMERARQFRELMGREPTEQEKLTMAGFAAKGRDPETGYETVEETTMTDNGERRVTRRVPIMAGSAPQGQQAPYPDGTKLRGPDGKMYVVNGGVPVLAEKATPSPTKQRPVEIPPGPSMLDPVQHMNHMRKYGSGAQ